MTMIRGLTRLVGLAAFLALAGCDIHIPIFHEDPTTLNDDRSEEAQKTDDRIRGDILSSFVEQEVGVLKNITIDVYEQRVLLTGTAAEPEAREMAGNLAGSAMGVVTVVNEIQVMENPSLRDTAEDLSIESKVKESLRKASDINSFNMRWHSVNGVVYIFGTAKSEPERDRALELVRSIGGVKNVVDHITVRTPEGAQSWLDNLL